MSLCKWPVNSFNDEQKPKKKTEWEWYVIGAAALYFITRTLISFV